MSRYDLLLLDSVVVIQLHALGLWGHVLRLCDVHLTRSIVDEARFYVDDQGDRHNIDLTIDEAAGRITVHVPLRSDTQGLCANFGPNTLEKLDAGELDALTVLYSSLDEYIVCSADRIVFRALGALRRSNQGISLEEVLKTVGLTATLDSQFSKSFRELWSRRGFQEGIQGLSDLR